MGTRPRPEVPDGDEAETCLKGCTWCKKNKPLSAFQFNHRAPDGFQYNCRSCVSERDKLRRLRDAYRRVYVVKNSFFCTKPTIAKAEQYKQLLKEYKDAGRDHLLLIRDV